MNGWALNTAVIPDTRYHRDIFPLTSPIFSAYASRWEMDYVPSLLTPSQLEEFHGTSPAPAGTEACYANVPTWRRLLDEYEGVVFFDSDAVVVDHSFDLCVEASWQKPIAATVIGDVVNLGAVAMLSTPMTRTFMDEIWSSRDLYKRYQWLEQAAAMALLGWDPNYPGDGLPGRFLGETEFTPLFKRLSPIWNCIPQHPISRPLVCHPAGVQPYEERLRLIREYVEQYHLLNTSTHTGR